MANDSLPFQIFSVKEIAFSVKACIHRERPKMQMEHYYLFLGIFSRSFFFSLSLLSFSVFPPRKLATDGCPRSVFEPLSINCFLFTSFSPCHLLGFWHQRESYISHGLLSRASNYPVTWLNDMEYLIYIRKGYKSCCKYVCEYRCVHV